MHTAKSRLSLGSRPWVEFIDSSARGLHMNLTQISLERPPGVGLPDACPGCGRAWQSLSEADVSRIVPHIATDLQELMTEQGTHAVIMPLVGTTLVARECSCNSSGCRTSLKERAEIACRLLSILNEGVAGAQRAVQLAALRQANHIVLSLSRGDSSAKDRAFDLVLSALVIMLDARASWLSYTDNGDTVRIIRGDCHALDEHLAVGTGAAIMREVSSGAVRGTIGVLDACDATSAQSLISLMVEECRLVFETCNLFRMLETNVRRVLGAMSSSVLLVDANGLVSYLNGAAERLLGVRYVDIAGMPASNIEAPWTSSVTSDPRGRTRGQKDSLLVGTEQKWVDWQANPLRDGQRIVGWLILADDKTHYYRWLEAGRQAERLATASMFVGALAHEVRNPLATARGLTQLMGKMQEPEKMQGYRDLIVRELDRAARLLNEFLLLGKPAQIVPEPIDLSLFIKDVLPLLEGETVGTNVQIVANLEPVPPVCIDPGQMTQVVLNLGRNAIQAVGNCGVVTAKLHDSPAGVVLAFEDTGPGLSPAILEKLFRPFFTTKELGTGLGLTISQAIVHNHGGHISASNAPHGGARFAIVLPAASVSALSDPDIVIVTADEATRIASEQTLRAAGLRTWWVPVMGELLVLGGRYQPPVILIDISVWDEQIIPIIRREMPESAILVAADATDGRLPEGVTLLPKPLNYIQLIQRVQALLNRSDWGTDLIS